MKLERKIIVCADEMAGGVVSTFCGREEVVSTGRVNVSRTRRCIALDRRAVCGKFDFGAAPASPKAVFRIRGMWDIYKDMPFKYHNTTRTLDTAGDFQVSLNGEIIYAGVIALTNYRKWRFWPSIDIHFTPSLLKAENNVFTIEKRSRRFKILSPEADISAEMAANTVFQLSDVQVLAYDDSSPNQAVKLPKGTYIGHLVSGHGMVQLEKDDFDNAVDLFLSERQGNLLVFLAKPGKTARDVDLGAVDECKLIDSGLHAALRYYGENRDEHYAEMVRSFVKRLGANFVGFGPHEQHGAMTKIIPERAAGNDVSRYALEYVEAFKERVAKIRRINPASPIWDTDPSFYSRFHMMGGAAFPAVELMVSNASLHVASARGTARAYGKAGWAAINSFECQAYGGLGFNDLEADEDPNFLTKRENLWWLSQYLLYLGGARTIYSESGLFEHQVTLQLTFDDPHLVNLRKSQAELVEFAAAEHLNGQPVIDIAYLQGRHEVYKGDPFNKLFHDAMGNSLYSWKSLEVCFPDIPRRVPYDDSFEAYRENQCRPVSDTPFGDADILPVEARSEVLSRYSVLIMTGWHTMTTGEYEKVRRYCANGGTLALLLPHLTESTDKRDPVSRIRHEWLEGLCGVRLTDGANVDCQIGDISVDSDRGIRFPELVGRLRAARDGADHCPLTTKIVRALAETRVVAGARTPFLVENKLGRGRVFLFNVADFPDQSTVYELINAALRDIVTGVPRRVFLKHGRHVTFFLYRVGAGRHRLYALRNDWFDGFGEGEATFSVFGKEVTLLLRPGTVERLDVDWADPEIDA